MNFSDIEMLHRLQLPEGKVDIVLDTDTYNEVDDQFAILYALMSPEKINLKAIYAAPFYYPKWNKKSSSPEDGMLKSFDEIMTLLELMNIDSSEFVYKGSREFLKDKQTPIKSEAVSHLVELIMGNYTSQNPLYVVSIAAITNIASAILIEPKICDRICVVWLGGPIHSWNTAREFNLSQDVLATQIVFESNVSLIQFPCFGVTSHLLTSLAELENCLDTTIPAVKKLIDNFRDYANDHFGYNKEIWDIGPIAFLIDPNNFTPSFVIRRPQITKDETYSFPKDTQFMRVVERINRNDIFKDMFLKLNNISKT